MGRLRSSTVQFSSTPSCICLTNGKKSKSEDVCVCETSAPCSLKLASSACRWRKWRMTSRECSHTCVWLFLYKSVPKHWTLPSAFSSAVWLKIMSALLGCKNCNGRVKTAQRNNCVATLCTAQHVGNTLAHCGTCYNDDSRCLRYSE